MLGPEEPRRQPGDRAARPQGRLPTAHVHIDSHGPAGLPGGVVEEGEADLDRLGQARQLQKPRAVGPGRSGAEGRHPLGHEAPTPVAFTAQGIGQ